MWLEYNIKLHHETARLSLRIEQWNMSQILLEKVSRIEPGRSKKSIITTMVLTFYKWCVTRHISDEEKMIMAVVMLEEDTIE